MTVRSRANRGRISILCQLWSIYLLLTIGGNIIFKELELFGEIYTVSDTGDVYKNGRMLKPYTNNGYRQIGAIGANKKPTTLRVARLVAMAFIPNDDPDVKIEVNHKDYNRSNDCADNLEWMSHADNVRYSVKNRKSACGENNPNYGNRKLSIWYKAHPEDALKNQSRKGLQNGRARGIKAFMNGELVGEFGYIVKCCEFLNSFFGASIRVLSIRSKIDASIRNNKPFRGFTFVKA